MMNQFKVWRHRNGSIHLVHIDASRPYDGFWGFARLVRVLQGAQ